MSALEAALALLVPGGTPVVEVRGSRRGSAAAIAGVSSAKRLVLLDGRRLSARRLTRLAREAGLVVDRELVVLPGLRTAAFVVEDSVESLTWFWNAFATVPPGRSRGSLLITATTCLGRNRHLVRWVGPLVAGRMVIVHRP